ncbi:MAG: DUF3794 domain-containing protein [Eubacteriales bacterium]|nr:DUF3794 domain-containing protein [Eubacteriales bacterium]
MELVKKEIHNAIWKVKNTMQFTIDDTINVLDSHLDMERLVLVKGNVVVDEVQAMVDRFQIKGTLNYQILYCADKENTAFDSIEGRVPFVEYINADGTLPEDYVEVHMSLNDLTVTMLHSRKISLKALVGMDYQVKFNEDVSILTGIEDCETAEILKEQLSMVSLRLQRKDIVSLEQTVEIPANKPNIYQVIWKSLSVTGVSMKPADGYLTVTGNICVFLVYTAEEEGMPIQYFTMEIPFEKQIDEREANEDMISGSVLALNQYQIHVVPDDSGEDRLLELRLDFSVEMKLYGREDLQMVRDAYASELELEAKYKNLSVWHLLLRNCAKTKVTDVVTMPKQHSVLQICHVEGSVSVDETIRSAKGIIVEGVVGTQITYLDKEESGAIASTTFDIPFTYEIEVPGMQEQVSYSIVPYIDRISALQNGETQIEIKSEVSLDVLAFNHEQTKVILGMETKPLDMERKKALPSVVGYIVKKGDTLWSIAKQYYTTVAQLKETNALEQDEIEEGARLVILKE